MKHFCAPMVLFCIVFISFIGSADDEKKTSVSRKVSGESANASAAEEARYDNSAKEQSQINDLVADRTPEVRLGVRLFYENRLSNPGANLAANCRTWSGSSRPANSMSFQFTCGSATARMHKT